MHYGITDPATFILGALFIVLLPGPNSFYVMTTASRWGIGPGYRAACGIFLGDLILMALAATGMASLLEAHPALFAALKYAGAAYLVWLGSGMLRSARQSWQRNGAIPPPAAPPGTARPFRAALLVSLMNPKSILFFMSFFIQFVSPDYGHPALTFLILGAIVQFFSALYLSSLIFGGNRLAGACRRSQRLSATATGGIGGLFIGFAIRLAGAD